MKYSKTERKLNAQISHRIKELREEIEPVQSKFAREHFIDRQLLNMWENTLDDRGITIHTIQKFCNMIDISLSHFFNSDLFE
ncbi:helix-turn-helix domain-containing protein [Luteirhabdus pelagi]|uniref:helix-turn-helix domain-containing protein n=1 Tax=Luteirhabdus pelagi TaxID=2792783 RepID=UPI00193A23A6|nr:helix-turn-helix transcriptional regulator [Luteirhabdus pelagi]